MELQTTLDVLRSISGALIDPWVVVDPDRTILATNRHFLSWYSRSAARKAKGSPFDHYVFLEWGGKDLDVIDETLQTRRPVRYDEVIGYVTDGPNLSLIVSTSIIGEDGGEPEAILVVLRDITDLARIQQKYRQAVDVDEA